MPQPVSKFGEPPADKFVTALPSTEVRELPVNALPSTEVRELPFNALPSTEVRELPFNPLAVAPLPRAFA